MPYTRAYHYLVQPDPLPAVPYSLPAVNLSGTDAFQNDSGQRIPSEELERTLHRLVVPIAALDPAEAVTAAKSLNLRERIAELLSQLEQRYKLTASIKRHLKERSLETSSQLLNLERPMSFGDPAADRKRSELESRMDQLYREGTREQHECWKDQLNLREQLLEASSEYRLAGWRSRLITGLGYGLGPERS